jgi:FtsP/CotA-like multicopper oxidase with cupredoxin domain
VQDDGTLGPFLTAQGAARGGTLGNVTTVNGITDPVLEVPANADIRLRFLNLDSSRIIDFAFEGAQAWAIATDGNPLDPFLLDEWRLGPAMRLDLALRTPAEPGLDVALMNNRSARPIRLARLRTKGSPLERKAFAPPRLKGPHLPEPDLEGATVLPFIFSTGSAKSVPPDLVLPNGEVMRFADSLCLSPKTFWAINRETWPEQGHEALPPPIATLEWGRTYVFELQNTSKIIHPIHLHGHSFKVLDSSEMDIPVHWADTTLIHPRERRRIAFVADNPGDWMFHCHLIEHQETGMMAIVRVA